jgi:hypothetical protein
MPIFAKPVPSEYAFATSYAPLDKPEPVRVAPHRWTRSDVIQKCFGGDESAFELAQRFGFPSPAARSGRDGSPLWNSDMVDTWRVALKADLARLAKILK